MPPAQIQKEQKRKILNKYGILRAELSLSLRQKEKPGRPIL